MFGGRYGWVPPKRRKVKTGPFRPQTGAQIVGLPPDVKAADFYNGEKKPGQSPSRRPGWRDFCFRPVTTRGITEGNLISPRQ